ncbi:cytochrome c-type biogenesis protein [Parabacteroides sp. PF5-5]|jgi:cytochrome c biogenesis protein CcdA|uniref:Urease accessory protein UreH-like transmembrane domain-containing protein n=2 Tax=root TaxID=1 RepID=A0A644X050_9ZZZZ|nr:cytochrome c-type biogenesis protein [Parabacteroides sp. PH5-39]MDH6317979.1 cytochrome c-type biogenesis protein [Parabacteroides sp. PF5-13]MDH6319923.1 cytochrome c-type biogenesis protein [Parabacteroides sp. PH5-13]MDH6323486.1 cytochrome c-type biogenesis protein [Parabacteroides sp. PH5-8]MDH6329167.1 cytochrome c-type biogenesis protein [Parabacteroides sp. PH5-41]MDH6336970.1 cytochrome c-type biogenesis protein [Parabacteroides sp. PF5-5]MDH6348036.1 cytochrome c-type biogenesis
MMEFLQNLVDGSNFPLLTAFLLGLMTAISPCPLATNITATAYLSKDIGDKRRVMFNGVFYTLGRMFTYTALGLIFYFGASQFQVAKLLQNVGGMWLGIALVIIGIFMLDIIKIKVPGMNKLTSKIENKKGKKTYLDAFLLGLLFALAFCPYSGVLYFGGLIPMTIASPSGLLLPPVFAIATGLPVIIIAWLLAYSVSNVGKFYNKMSVFQKWFKWIVAAVFIIVGIYYIITSI